MSKPFSILNELGGFGAEHRLSLQDAKLKGAFALHVGEAVDEILSNPALMHGHRVEAMFEAMLLSFGEFRLLKAEDGTRTYPEGKFIAPDFRVVLNDGTHWLIEVKNVYEADPFHQSRQLMKRHYFEKLSAYAQATGAELKVAIFWARWSMWTLVSPSRLMDHAGNLKIDMMTAATVNELGRLGDRSIGTRAPLRLRLNMDQSKTSPIDADGEVNLVFGEHSLFSEDREIVDPVELDLAWAFMEYGEWADQGAEAVIEGDRLLSLDFIWTPPQPSDQGFDFIGTLSRMFSRYYAQHTVKDGAVVQVHAPQRPNWFSPLLRSDYKSSSLPLWRFQLQPNYSKGGQEAGAA